MTMGWLGWAMLSAVFAAATAVLAKVGVQGVDSNLATAIRTTVILVFTWAIAIALEKHGGMAEICAAELGVPRAVGAVHGDVVALLFSRTADGAGVQCGADRQAERGAGDGDGVGVSGRDGGGDEAGGGWVDCGGCGGDCAGEVGSGSRYTGLRSLQCSNAMLLPVP